MAIIIFFFLAGYLASVFTSGMQKKAGYNIVDAFIPIKGNLNMAAMIGKPKYWAVLCYTPVFNFFVLATIFSDLARSFGRERFYEYFISMVFPFAYLPYLGFNQEDKYQGVPSKAKKGGIREWADAISFALIAATLIRWSTFEAYTIPTPSMEGSLLVGDFLFVSKLHYGPRTPITPLQVPLTHQYLWMTGDEMNGVPGVKAYSDAIQLPYNRIGGVTTIKNNDVVVFNWPADLQHTAVDLKTNYIKRCIAIAGDDIEVKNRVVYINGKKTKDPEGRQFTYDVRLKNQKTFNEIVDKATSNSGYGRSTDISNKRLQNFLYRLDVKVFNKTGQHIQKQGHGYYSYSTTEDGYTVSIPCTDDEKEALMRLGNHFDKISLSEDIAMYKMEIPDSYKRKFDSILVFSKFRFEQVGKIENQEKLTHLYNVVSESKDLKMYNNQIPGLKYSRTNSPNNFYFIQQFIDNTNNFGPVHVPAKGEKIAMTAENIKKYSYLICNYDHNDNAEVKDGKLLIDGKEVKEYSFNQNYYFMMGDNRNNSQDSRYWGFVPEDHVVGKAALIWFSLSSEPGSFLSRIRWSRILNLID